LFSQVSSRSHNAVIRVYDEAGNVIESNEHAGDFKEPSRESPLQGSRNAVSFSSARTTKRFPSLRCASAIQIVRP
jgi:hypothetical protein